MHKENDYMSDYDHAIFRLTTVREAEPEDYTGRGFYIAGAAQNAWQQARSNGVKLRLRAGLPS